MTARRPVGERPRVRLAWGAPLAILAACAGDAADKCPDEQIVVEGACVPYEPDDPVASTGWRPEVGTTWQIQYSDALDLTLPVEVYDLDLFDISAAEIATVKESGRLLCYFSAGSYEDWRPDADLFPEAALGRPLEGWPGEWWLDVTDPDVRAIMEARLDLAVERGCDGVDPDNVNGWENPTGFGLTETIQLEYNRFLADAAHERGLAVALKNDQLQLDALAEWFDLAVNEECAAFEECDAYAGFTAAGKPVLHVEYVDRWADAEALAADVCGVGPALDTLIKTWDLGPEFLPCW